MKLVYTNDNRILVNNAKNIVESAGVEVALKNEYATGGVGELSAFDAWLELWVVNDSDYESAMGLINASLNPTNSADWICNHCTETNGPAFEICWNCQRENT